MRAMGFVDSGLSLLVLPRILMWVKRILIRPEEPVLVTPQVLPAPRAETVQQLCPGLVSLIGRKVPRRQRVLTSRLGSLAVVR